MRHSAPRLRFVSTLHATFRLSLLGSLLLVVATAGVARGQLAPTCPEGGVLDRDRAYFGSTLSANECAAEGAVCEQVYFFSERRRAAAVCSGGRWLLRDEVGGRVPAACPEYVFTGDEIWNDGSYEANVCDAATAPTCDRTYFYRLPEGGAGYGTASCVDGRWQAEPAAVGNGDPFRLVRAASGSELAAFLKEGLKATWGGGSPYLYGPFLGGPSGEGGAPPAADAGAQLSETNVQEAGVDEADRVKSDGEQLYILRNFQSQRPDAASSAGGNRVRVLGLDESGPGAEPLAEIALDLAQSQYSRGMYLRSEEDQLVVISSGFEWDWSWFWYSPLAWLGATSSVASVDVSDPSAPLQDATLELEGEIISTRRIGRTLYLATRFQPQLVGLEPYQPGDPDASAQITRIEQASLSELLPTYRTDLVSEPQLVTEPHDCYMPTADAPITSADIVTLVAIDLDTMEITSSKCFVGASETIYVSLRSVYLASTRYEYGLVPGPGGLPVADWHQPRVETDLHKFSLDDGGVITYRASGVVDGHLGWNLERKPFRLSEQDDDLRVITYTDELTPDRSPVALSVLRDTGDDELALLSRLPNEQRPDQIGKPGEALYGTRFVGDRAYLVTFLVTDPLYVLDLSDPTDPYVAGELEITGYSDYLHPFEGGYLLGIGKDAVPDASGDFRGAWYQGVKVSLYDVSDPSDPFEADSVVIGKRGTEAPVLHNHRAFTFLPGTAGQNPRIAFGVTVNDRLEGGPPTSHPSTHYSWSRSGLELFEVDTSAGVLVERGEMVVQRYHPTANLPGFSQGRLSGDDRSVLFGDVVFYVHGDDVWVAQWNDPEVVDGPK